MGLATHGEAMDISDSGSSSERGVILVCFMGGVEKNTFVTEGGLLEHCLAHNNSSRVEHFPLPAVICLYDPAKAPARAQV